MSLKAVWKEIGTIISLILSAVAVCFSVFGLHQNLEFQRENTAKSVYRDYLQMAVKNPKLAGAEVGLTDQYKWFVAYFLWASEEVLKYASNDTGWRETITTQLNWHRDYLCGQGQGFDAALYAPELGRLIAKVCLRKVEKDKEGQP